MKCPECQHENPPDTFTCGKCGAEIQGSQEKISFTRTLEIPAKELSRGTVFADRSEILEDLGEGGMGRVFRVHDRKLEEEVALKLVRPEIASDRRMIERFKNEIKTARQVTHKNVCRMHDLGEAEDVAKTLKATVDGWLNDKLMRYYFLLQGAIEQAKGNLPDAIRYLEKAEELEHFEWNIGVDFQALFFDSLASAYERSGDTEKALEEYEKITRLTSGRYHYGDIYAKSFYRLGKVFEKLEQNAKASQNYQKFLDLWKNADPGLPEVEDATKRLAALKS